MKWIAVILVLGLSGCTSYTGPVGTVESFLGAIYDGDEDALLGSVSTNLYDFYDCESSQYTYEDFSEEVKEILPDLSKQLRREMSRSDFVAVDNHELMPAVEDPYFNKCSDFVFMPSDVSVTYTSSVEVNGEVYTDTESMFLRYESGRWLLVDLF